MSTIEEKDTLKLLTCDTIDSIYEEFKLHVLNKDARPKLYGDFVYIDCQKVIDSKFEIFWHMIGLENSKRFDVFPCYNDISYHLCQKNCVKKRDVVLLSDGKSRNVCHYRALRVLFLIDIINLANANNAHIKHWKKDSLDFIRYENGIIDYVAIFKKGPKFYNLVTAYPVFYIYRKNSFDIDYDNYIRSKT